MINISLNEGIIGFLITLGWIYAGYMVLTRLVLPLMNRASRK